MPPASSWVKRWARARREEAYLYGKRMIAGAMLAGVACWARCMITLRGPILSLYTGLSPEVIDKAGMILLFGSLTMWFRAFNCINIVGILRSGGDTVFSLKLDVGQHVAGGRAAVRAGYLCVEAARRICVPVHFCRGDRQDGHRHPALCRPHMDQQPDGRMRESLALEND